MKSRCVPLPITDPFKLINNSSPFNKYAFLTTHNSYAINRRRVLTGSPRCTLTNQEDSITHQLNNGVRALMLDTYDFEGDVWLCHSLGGECYDFTAFMAMMECSLGSALIAKNRVLSMTKVNLLYW
eukprot:TRINITY_DN40_c1_g1_i2.p1 TRINITY_DN40_c1_g1~~TRINITY_DN40_c1_g1_i2.p1  ORF type:complete len:126 (+),score=5.59 TRINITY_DN40_c1_g1_i2:122-499(+)